MRLTRETLDIGIGEEEQEALLEALFAIFYINNGYILASQESVFLLDILIATFRLIGLRHQH